MPSRSIGRAELAEIIERASVDCAARSREKLRRVAAETDAVAVGWFHCNGTKCPARQANYHHMGFQTRFDHAMCERFRLDFDSVTAFPNHTPFVVEVVDSDA